MKNLKKDINFKNFKLGLKKGWSIPLLPESVIKILNHPFTCRVIGGTAVIVVLYEKHLLLPTPLSLIVAVIALLQMIQITIISLFKVVYGFRKLIRNPEDFEVRN